jgi:hypothetical protein
MSEQYEHMELRAGELRPEEFFAAQGWKLRCFEEEGEFVADIAPAGRLARWLPRFTRWVPRYGSGRDAEHAALAAMRRWQSEQGT